MKLNDRIEYLFNLHNTLVECAITSADYDVLMKKARRAHREYDRLSRIREIRDNICMTVAACLTGFAVYVLFVMIIICFG